MAPLNKVIHKSMHSSINSAFYKSFNLKNDSILVIERLKTPPLSDVECNDRLVQQRECFAHVTIYKCFMSKGMRGTRGWFRLRFLLFFQLEQIHIDTVVGVFPYRTKQILKYRNEYHDKSLHRG
ncbi:hypothetical protein ACOME3_006370 [Neoechinorhynchus agilis]